MAHITEAPLVANMQYRVFPIFPSGFIFALVIIIDKKTLKELKVWVNYVLRVHAFVNTYYPIG